MRGRIARTKPTDLEDLRAKGFKPGKKPVERSLIRKWTVEDCLDFLKRIQALEVEQCLARENPGDPDLVVERCHSTPR
jgi:hypothetical protein